MARRPAPEILNRIGDNVVVFDFVRPDVATEILDAMLSAIVSDLGSERGLNLDFTDIAREDLRRLCLADLSNGGRGIRNKVETYVLNPLARAVFDEEPASGELLLIEGVESGNDGVARLRLSRGASGRGAAA